VLLPDAPVTVPGYPGVARLRELVRDGILVLTSDTTRLLDQVAEAVRPAPARIVAIPEIDPTGLLARAVAARPGEALVIRPDGHLAAVVRSDDVTAVSAAMRRALGLVSL
jgi:pentachlorophenol monooxygenase/3-(3-hydroxy-phenyl)propionate hydroxylase